VRSRGLLTLTAAVLLASCSSSDDDAGDLAQRQADVAERGAEVMPFDLEATTHHFEPTGTGVVQTVVADDAADAEQVELVRQHLLAESERFRQGDYGDPAEIHGHDMPGLADLEAGAAQIDVVYAEIPTGAVLTFTTSDPALVAALHLWADAQTMDHGDHAD
jgi:hypothetical protein